MINNTDFIIKTKLSNSIVGYITEKEIINPQISKDKDGKDIFTFSLTRKANNILDKTDLINKDYYIEFGQTGQIYNIVKFTKSRSNGIISFNVECESSSYKLNTATVQENFSFTGTISGLLQNLPVSFLGFTYEIENDTTVELNYINEETFKKVIQDAVNQANLQMKIIGNIIYISEFVGDEKYVYISISKNLKDLEVEQDEDDNLYYKIDLLELQNSSEYVDTNFQFIETIDLFDKVIINDPEFNIVNQELIILEYNYDPTYIKDSNIVLGNLIKDITTEAITKDNLISSINESTEKINGEKVEGGGEANTAKRLIDNQPVNPSSPGYLEINLQEIKYFVEEATPGFLSISPLLLDYVSGFGGFIKIDDDGLKIEIGTAIFTLTYTGTAQLEAGNSIITFINNQITINTGAINDNSEIVMINKDIYLNTPFGNVYVNGTPL